MSSLLDIVTISGGNIAGHMSSSLTTNQSSQSLIISCLSVPSHATLYLLPLSVLNAMPVTLYLFPLSTAGRLWWWLALIGALSHREPYHASSYSTLFLGSTGSNWRYAALCNSCSHKGNTDHVGVCFMSLSWQVKAGCLESHWDRTSKFYLNA